MIEVTGVNKKFGEIKALDNIVATIQEGSISWAVRDKWSR